ncbi:hypothetical protein RFI_09531 [Reticulomyxa filosa]|uniref:Transmembrane protein n=1 Tax=Reticulomyxa filosa TaxID=46433 RepID=X6NPH4_RETFI|nr:hypothetical protein RFI_09531 [Reticulomyxa filosa]|eukprot:ETO27599.1 hypothetical protein RFI_09531 [Reticulomyxa filosa]
MAEVNFALVRNSFIVLFVLSFGLFFGLIHYWILVTIFVPTLVVGAGGSLIVQQFHKGLHGGPGGQGKQDTWMRQNFLSFVLLESMIHSSVIDGLCGSEHSYPHLLSVPTGSSGSSTNPTCLSFTTRNIPNVLYILVMCFFAYLNLCVFIDMCYASIPGKRSLWYRVMVSWPSSIHFTSCVLSLSVLPIFPILAYISWNFLSPSSSSTWAFLQLLPFYLYLSMCVLSVSGLFNSLFTSWTYVDIHHSADPVVINQDASKANVTAVHNLSSSPSLSLSSSSLSRIDRRNFKEWSISRTAPSQSDAASPLWTIKKIDSQDNKFHSQWLLFENLSDH